jgi:hypothetical protein
MYVYVRGTRKTADSANTTSTMTTLRQLHRKYDGNTDTVTVLVVLRGNCANSLFKYVTLSQHLFHHIYRVINEYNSDNITIHSGHILSSFFSNLMYVSLTMLIIKSQVTHLPLRNSGA